MPTVTPHPASIQAFATRAAFEAWLSAHHDSATELWLKIHKKDSGLPTVTYAEALEVALCWGWIDGQKKSFDATSFLQRFSPRRPRSVWSAINTRHVERLIREGRMTPHGMRHVEAAKADGRWTAAYEGAARMEMPADLVAAVEASPRALKTFRALNAANRFALAYRVHTKKTPAGRATCIADLVAMLAAGKTPHDNGPRKKSPAPRKRRKARAQKTSSASRAQ